jgi:glycerol kinase
LGSKLTISKHGLITTMACGFDAKKITYALEGSVFIAGAVIQWLRDQLKIIGKASETEQIAKSVKDSGGIYFVPAFVGLGAPYWNMQTRGNISGLTRGTNQAHIVRAALESIAFQTKDVVEAMEKDAKIKIKEFFVDGKACQNNFLMQFQADILPAVVKRPKIIETTAQGAAYLAGIGAGIWKDENKLRSLKEIEQTFKPNMNKQQREMLYEGWKSAVKASMSF